MTQGPKLRHVSDIPVNETLDAIVAAPTEAERLDIEANVIVQTDNGLQPEDPEEQPAQNPEPYATADGEA